ncbi:MAG: DUF5320 domain-containing protein [Candidatus Riflebacteria bacterium]|nr:DUF5320 domain-containing protein [Candidatus Riflebacteria bacterium]
MPRGDGTGPQGQGPRTGRGMGFCNGFDAPGFATGGGRGQGIGRRMGGRGPRGWGRGRWSARQGWAGTPPGQTPALPRPVARPAADDIEELHERLDTLQEQVAELTRLLKKDHAVAIPTEPDHPEDKKS